MKRIVLLIAVAMIIAAMMVAGSVMASPSEVRMCPVSRAISTPLPILARVRKTSRIVPVLTRLTRGAIARAEGRVRTSAFFRC